MDEKEACPACGGSGQIGYFQGVSRFLLSWEECPACAGLGLHSEQPVEKQPAGRGTPNRRRDEPASRRARRHR